MNNLKDFFEKEKKCSELADASQASANNRLKNELQVQQQTNNVQKQRMKKLEGEVEFMAKQHSAQMEQIEERHSASLSKMASDHEEEVTALKEEIAGLKEQMESLRRAAML